MRSKRPGDDMDYLEWSFWNNQDKKKKEDIARKKAERRERNKYWMEVMTFVIMVLSVAYSCLASVIKQTWQWFLSLWTQ